MGLGGIQLRGYTEISDHYTNWLQQGSAFWVACYWHHLTHQTYMDLDWNGRKFTRNPLSNPVSAPISTSCPVDPSIVLVLDAWIRFFECWEPE